MNFQLQRKHARASLNRKTKKSWLVLLAPGKECLVLFVLCGWACCPPLSWSALLCAPVSFDGSRGSVFVRVSHSVSFCCSFTIILRTRLHNAVLVCVTRSQHVCLQILQKRHSIRDSKISCLLSPFVVKPTHYFVLGATFFCPFKQKDFTNTCPMKIELFSWSTTKFCCFLWTFCAKHPKRKDACLLAQWHFGIRCSKKLNCETLNNCREDFLAGSLQVENNRAETVYSASLPLPRSLWTLWFLYCSVTLSCVDWTVHVFCCRGWLASRQSGP